MQYAVNIADLTKDSILASFLFLPLIAKDRTMVRAEKGMIDGMAVLLNCDQEQWEGVVFIARKKYTRNLFRLYESKTGISWKRV